ncbi:class A beta-lactamase [Streptomyces gamaensis]|uniref:Beta-lactamase n=1 Tax=Streptomyces gamaensis TaxID=1763542 RepID=A0ABW0ZD51_9ACTN
METKAARPSRRAVLAVGAGASLAAAMSFGASGTAFAASRTDTAVRRLRALEAERGARLGVFAHDTGSRATIRYRAGELFPMCSTFKTIAVAAVLRDLDRDGGFLAKRLHYTEQYAKASGWYPETGKPHNLANGMTVGELCDAAITQSDNAAANLLLQELGGPDAITRFCESIGDRTTNLTRIEPYLNSAEPDRKTDTTTPEAIGSTYERLVLGDALDCADQKRLEGWLLANTTNKDTFRAGLPEGWQIADKTGSGSYGTRNDVGIVRPPRRKPIVLSVLSTKPQKGEKEKGDDQLVADAAAIVADAFA